MPEIYLNGKAYGPSKTPASLAGMAARAIQDGEGNNIKDTYYRDPYKKFDSTKDFQKNLYPGAGPHNSIFMGRNLTERFESGDVYEKIADGSFEDLFIGDYFIKAINGANKTCRFAGFNIYMDAKHNYPNHAVIVTDEHFGEAKMNSTNTVVGGYKGSQLYKNNIAAINGYLQTAFGSDHLVVLKDYLTNAVDATIQSPGYRGWNTCSCSYEETDSIADLMTEIEVYGSRVWSSSGYDVGIGKTQLPLFSLAPQYINPSRYSWWLRDIIQYAYISLTHYDGSPVCVIISSGGVSVRPRWCIC